MGPLTISFRVHAKSYGAYSADPLVGWSDVLYISHPAFASRHPATGRRSTTKLRVVRILHLSFNGRRKKLFAFFSGIKNIIFIPLFCKMVRVRGVEPLTIWLKVKCSTNWATPSYRYKNYVNKIKHSWSVVCCSTCWATSVYGAPPGIWTLTWQIKSPLCCLNTCGACFHFVKTKFFTRLFFLI